jgi:hypothetical protein
VRNEQVNIHVRDLVAPRAIVDNGKRDRGWHAGAIGHGYGNGA